MKHGLNAREGFIIARALALASAAIVHLPQKYQAESDRRDMLALLHRIWPHSAAFELAQAAETMAHLEDRYRAPDIID